MPIFKHIFDVFSTRPEPVPKPKHVIPESTRTRIVVWRQEGSAIPALHAPQCGKRCIGSGDSVTAA